MGAVVTDLLLFLKIVRPDGTTETRYTRLPPEGTCELRLRIHDSHFAKAAILRGIRLAAASPGEAPQGHAASAALAATSGNNDQH